MKKFRTSVLACVAALTLGGLAGCKRNEGVIHVESVVIDSQTINLVVGETRTLSATVSPENATDKGLTYASSDESVLTVSSDGKVTAVAEGTAVITITSVDGSKTATINVVVGKAKLYATLPIRQSESFQNYSRHIQPDPLNPLAEFNDRTQMYEVGNDNKFSFRPQFSVTDEDDQDIDPNAWYEPFTISVFKKVGEAFEAAPTSEYEIVDALKCEIKFADTTVGEYKVSVQLGGLTAEEIADLDDLTPITAEYNIKVIDGYNVTKAVELAYLDTTVKNQTGVSWGSGNDEIHPDLPAFKTAHGLTAATPKALVFHEDLHITKDDLPAEYFFRPEDTGNWSEGEKTRSLGSMRDWVYFYNKVDSGNMTLSGNYFTLDWSEIPLITRPWGHEVDGVDEKVESHGGFFRSYGGNVEVKNVNFIGNSHAAKTEADVKLAGGIIGFKTEWPTQTFVANNVLGHGCYITFFTSTGDVNKTDLRIYKTKLFDGYNCFIYNWGGTVYAEDSIFEGCGGPVIIQDHTGHENQVYDVLKFYKVADEPTAEHPLDEQNMPDANTVAYSYREIGAAPSSTWVDCEFNNYLIGTEAWFQSFGAVAVTAQIKQLGDFLYGYSNGARSMVFDAQHNAASYAALSAASQDSLFNFVVLNKSGSAEGMTAYQVEGENLVEVDNFNYLAPKDKSGQIRAISGPTDEEGIAELMGAVERFKFRQIGTAGAPIFETAGGHAYYPGEGEALLDFDSQAINPMSTTFLSGAHEYTTLYFNGMGLVFGLNKVAA